MADPAQLPTLGEALARAAGVPGAGLRFLDRRERETFLSWKELFQRSLAVAAGLRSLGVEDGERVALVFPTGPDFFAGFFGAIVAGAVPTPLYPPVRLGRLDEYRERTARMIGSAQVRIVLADGRVRRLLGETIAQARPRFGCRSIAEIEALAPPLAGPRSRQPGDLGLVQFSSGTTVEPKPVALSHQALMSQATILNSFWPADAKPEASGVSWLPLYHDMGLIGCVLPALERPAPLTLFGPELFVVRPALWLRALSTYRATISPAPNFAYALCVAKIKDEELAGVDLSSWRVALNGAEAVAPSVLEAFARRFEPYGFRREALTPVYGLSEAALAVTFSGLDTPFQVESFDRQELTGRRRAEPKVGGQELVSVGGPLPGFELEIRDREGVALEPRVVGRVWVKGPSLMTGYLGQPEATAQALIAGWLDTGDEGFVHNGELFLTGRAKDLVILRGRNHSPESIEHALLGVEGVRPGCVVAASWLPEGAEGEHLALFVEAAREASGEQLESLPDAARTAVLAKVGLAVDRVEVLAPGTIPRTSSGKLRRAETVRRFRAGALLAPAPVTPLRLAGAMARPGLAFTRLRFDKGQDG